MKGCADKVTWQTNSMSSSPYLQNARDSMLARREADAPARRYRMWLIPLGASELLETTTCVRCPEAAQICRPGRAASRDARSGHSP